VLYVADQAHVPYGGRPLDEIKSFATEISRFLADNGCRAIIMACNISSATALTSVCELLSPLPVLGVIAPAAERVAREYVGPIGVLATVGTVNSGAYTAHIQRANPLARVVEVPCSKFVPLIEAGEHSSRDAECAVREYLEPLAESGCRTIVLGCTHYPFMLPLLKQAANVMFKNPVTFVDPAEDVVATLSVRAPDLSTESINSGNVLLTTGDEAHFREQTAIFLPGIECKVSTARWIENNKLTM